MQISYPLCFIYIFIHIKSYICTAIPVNNKKEILDHGHHLLMHRRCPQTGPNISALRLYLLTYLGTGKMGITSS